MKLGRQGVQTKNLPWGEYGYLVKISLTHNSSPIISFYSDDPYVFYMLSIVGSVGIFVDAYNYVTMY